MKIDKHNPRHWLYLGLFGLNVLAAIVMRPMAGATSRKQVILYGHKLNGNLLALYRYMKGHPELGLDPVFLTMDRGYYRQLKNVGVAAVRATQPACTRLLSNADAVIADHGIHAMQPMLRWSNIKFFDVWHGIPFKGFDADDFHIQHRFAETWVASPLLARLNIERFGFPEHKVRVTGYARTDRLVNPTEDPADLRRQLDLPATGPVVVVAPTWQQDDKKRSVFPFGVDAATFYTALADVAAKFDATVVMRKHLNSTGHGEAVEAPQHPHIVHRAYADYPDTEALLLVSDVLVCDWSSIAFDYLLLKRPTLFLDVKPPFGKGFSLDESYRFGPIVPDIDSLARELSATLAADVKGDRSSDHRWEAVIESVYGDRADGRASQRCVARLIAWQ